MRMSALSLASYVIIRSLKFQNPKISFNGCVVENLENLFFFETVFAS